MESLPEPPEFLLTNYAFEQTPHPDVTKVISLVTEVENKNKFIEWFSPDSTASLPFGIIKQKGAMRYVIAVDSMQFKKSEATFSAFAAIDFPGTTKKIAFRASNVKFNPSGVLNGDQAKLFLVGEQYIKVNSAVTLHLFEHNKNWVEWNCGGFKAINLSGEFIFRKSLLVADDNEKVKTTIKGDITKDTVVRAVFNVYTEDIQNFICSAKISPFKLRWLKDWSFVVNDATLDMSINANSPVMAFPAGYENPNLPSLNAWRGFYLKSVKITLPPEFSSQGQRRQILANNIIIDETGLSGYIEGKPILSLNEGSMSGWKYSIDELGVGFVRNQISEGHLTGLVHLPITDENQNLKYKAAAFYNYGTNELDFNFMVKPEREFKMDVFGANVELTNNSSISIIKRNGYYKPTALLNGKIGFDHANFSTAGNTMMFSDLRISTEEPFIHGGLFSLNTSGNNPANTHRYPVSLQGITFGIKDKAPILGFNMLFNLVDEAEKSISAGTVVYIKGKIEAKDEQFPADNFRPAVTFKKTKWMFDRIYLGGVSVDVQTLPCTIKGSFEHKQDFGEYGEGFFGKAEVKIVKVIQDPIAVSAGFGRKEDFKYFFLDFMVPSKYIVPGTPMALSHFIGGVSYHMKPDKLTEPEYVALRKSFNTNNPFALKYTPDKNTKLGLKAGASGEFTVNETLCNGDYFLKLNFNEHWGLSYIGLSGEIRALAKSDDVDIPIKGKAAMDIDLDAKSFDFLAQVSASAYEVLSGTGYFKFHTEPAKWHVCFGTPSKPMNIKFLNFAGTPTYIMTGNDIEPALPAPNSIQQHFGNAFVSRDAEDLSRGKGLCIGSKVHSNIYKNFHFWFFNVEGLFDFDLGFDMMLRNYGKNARCSRTDKNVGFLGFQAEGNAYLVFHPLVRVYGYIKFPFNCPYDKEVCVCGICETVKVKCILEEDFNFKVFEGGMLSILHAQFPKPIYFNGTFSVPFAICGKVDGRFDFNYEYGQNCGPIIK
ncbi:MAG: hypothetical protein IPM51_13505 [Sphingobacteriaceae bacterium]|nr:hypothetical protein [Sphingobacteriaceae bacterium]